MDEEELEELLEGLIETPAKEFKGSCQWAVGTFVKDILAMSNERNGGRIIVGVEECSDVSFTRVGVQTAARDSYVPDLMKDQVGPFADPYVQFNVYFPTDRDGREYVVIEVLPFDEDPVICKKSHHDVCEGRLYYRGKGRRPESSAVSNSSSLREILRRASAKKIRIYKELGFDIAETDVVKARLDKELDGL